MNLLSHCKILLMIQSLLGSYHFLPGGGGCLSVIAGRQFFVVPPWHAQKNSGPPQHAQKILVPPPLAYAKKFWSPPFDPQNILVPPLTTPKNSGPPPQTDGRPLPVKNDSSLSAIHM